MYAVTFRQSYPSVLVVLAVFYLGHVKSL